MGDLQDIPEELPPTQRINVLSTLMAEAPSQYRCALDGVLMMDPVRSPDGIVFERVALARALQIGGYVCKDPGHCPITGKPLSLSDCCRVADLRRDIVAWVRHSRPQRDGEQAR